MKTALTKHAIFPALVAAPVFAAFWCGVFFRGFDSPAFAPALILVSVAAALLLLPGWRRGWDFPASGAAGFLALFWLWMGWSLTWSAVPHVSMIFCMTIGALPLLFFSVVQHHRAQHVADALWLALSVAGSLLACWAVIQYLFLPDIAGGRVHHPMLNANNLAVVLVLTFFLLLGYFCRASRAGQIAAGLLMILCLVGVMATQSRGGSLGLVTGGMIFIVLCRVTIQKNGGAFLMFGIASLLVIGAVLSGTYIQEAGQVRLVGLEADSGASIRERFMLWGAALRMIADHPFPGPGLGVFYLVFPPYRNVGDYSDGYFLHVDPWQFGIEMSIVATILFYAFAIAVLVRLIRALRVAGVGDDRRPALVVPFCGLFALLLNAHVNFDLYMLPALLVGAVMLIFWALAADGILGPARLRLEIGKRAHAVFIIPAFILLLLAGPVWVARAGIGVAEANKASIAMLRGDAGAARDHVEAALRYGPENYYRAYYLDALWRGQVLQKHFIVLDARQRAALYDGAMAALDRALSYNPYNIQALSHRAVLHYIAYPRLDPKGLTRAVETLEYALALDPVSFDVRMGLARMYELQGRVQQAIAVLEDGQRYRATQIYAPAPYLAMLARLKAKAGDRAGAAAIRPKIEKRAAETAARMERQGSVDRFISDRIKALLHR